MALPPLPSARFCECSRNTGCKLPVTPTGPRLSSPRFRVSRPGPGPGRVGRCGARGVWKGHLGCWPGVPPPSEAECPSSRAGPCPPACRPPRGEGAPASCAGRPGHAQRPGFGEAQSAHRPLPELTHPACRGPKDSDRRGAERGRTPRGTWTESNRPCQGHWGELRSRRHGPLTPSHLPAAHGAGRPRRGPQCRPRPAHPDLSPPRGCGWERRGPHVSLVLPGSWPGPPTLHVADNDLTLTAGQRQAGTQGAAPRNRQPVRPGSWGTSLTCLRDLAIGTPCDSPNRPHSCAALLPRAPSEATQSPHSCKASSQGE